MSKAKDTETVRLGHHLFTIDKKFCSIHYRGVIGKETDKTFLLNILKGVRSYAGGRNYDKVLKTNYWVAVPANVDPARVLEAFDRAKKAHAGMVEDYRTRLRAAENARFVEALAALEEFHPSMAETEIGATAG